MYFSTFDLQSGYHQVKLDEETRDATSFLTHMGKFKYTVMAQGVKNAPNSFQSLMDVLLKGIQYKYVMAYLDDTICFSPSFEQHILDVREPLLRFRVAGLRLKPSKCHIAVPQIHVLGHVLSSEGVSTDPEKVAYTSIPPTRLI